jgi:hypothetical protein
MLLFKSVRSLGVGAPFRASDLRVRASNALPAILESLDDTRSAISNPHPWWMVFLLLLASLINYLDRATVSIRCFPAS